MQDEKKYWVILILFAPFIFFRDKQINYWIGLSRATHNDSFKWSDSSEAEYFYWKEGEPSSDEEANCAHFEYSKGSWEAMKCSNTKSYICKILRGIVYW